MGFLVPGIVILVVTFWLIYRARKYEFENRTDGGVVHFKNFGASIWHRVKMWILSLLGIAGFMMVLWGGILVMLPEG